MSSLLQAALEARGPARQRFEQFIIVFSPLWCCSRMCCRVDWAVFGHLSAPFCNTLPRLRLFMRVPLKALFEHERRIDTPIHEHHQHLYQTLLSDVELTA